MYDYKEKLILSILIEKNTYVSSQELAVLSGINKRSIRDVCASLKKTTRKETDFYIHSKPHYGYKAVFYDEAKRDIYRRQIDIVIKNPKEAFSNQRQVLLCLHLMMEPHQIIKIEDLEQLLYLSRTQVNTALQVFKTHLEVFFVYIEMVPGKGIKVIGAENDIRRSIVKLILLYFEELMGNESEDVCFCAFKSLYYKVYEATKQIFHKRCQSVAKKKLEIIAVNISVLLCRVKNNHLLNTIFVENSDSWTQDEFFISFLQSQGITYYENEQKAIQYYFLSEREQTGHNLHPLAVISEEIVAHALQDISTKTGLCLYTSKELICSLSVELKRILNESILGFYHTYQMRKNERPIYFIKHFVEMFVEYLVNIAKIEIDEVQKKYIMRCFFCIIAMKPLPSLRVCLAGYESEIQKQYYVSSIEKNMKEIVHISTSDDEDVDVILSIAEQYYANKPIIYLHTMDASLKEQLFEIQKQLFYRQYHIEITEKKDVFYSSLKNLEQEKEFRIKSYLKKDISDYLVWEDFVQGIYFHIYISDEISKYRMFVEKMEKVLVKRKEKLNYSIFCFVPKEEKTVMAALHFLNDLIDQRYAFK